MDSFGVETTNIHGCYVVRFAGHHDDRGSFFRKFSRSEFLQAGLNSSWVQTNVSSNDFRGTLRGFHLQRKPAQEIKLVTCVSGKIFDVALDLRPESDSFLQSFSLELKQNDNTLIYIPEGVAHAYLTLADSSTILYQVSKEYSPEHTWGVRFSDPKIAVNWPIDPRIVSTADLAWPSL